MTREEYIKNLIKAKGYNVKEFSNLINIPYTTLLSMLKSIGGAGIDNVIKVCKGLNITINELNNCGNIANITLTSHEQKLLTAYRSHPEMQPAIDKLLGVDNNTNCEIAKDMTDTLKAVSAVNNFRTKQK